jgi:hypothetical protein
MGSILAQPAKLFHTFSQVAGRSPAMPAKTAWK